MIIKFTRSMFQLLAYAIVYFTFLFNFLKEYFANGPRRPPRDLDKFFKQQFDKYFNRKSIQIPIIADTERSSAPANVIQFDTTANFKNVMQEVSDDFGGAYGTIREMLLTTEDPQLEDVVQWIDRVIEYNVPHGKKTRGLILAASYKYFAPKYDLTKKNIELSCILGWCMEFLQASMLVIDDIMDQSVMRRGQRCWYMNEKVGFMAINDAILLHHSIFILINQFFSKHECYTDIVELTRITSYKTALGQCIDCLTTPEGGATDFSLLTPSRYATIVKYKTSLYSFCLPVRLALLFAGIKNEKIHSVAQNILIRMGHLFQCQDDFIDCFGDPEITGKIGTDIEDGKCCWMAVEAVKRMSDEEIKEFRENYGIKSSSSAKIIKSLYEKVNMRSVYTEFEDSEYEEIRKEIAGFGRRSRVEMKPFYGLLDIIYKRKK